jgi:hypothetical protein
MKGLTARNFLTVLTLLALIVCGSWFAVNPIHAQAEDEKQSESTSSTCPKCKGPMEPGYVRDYFASNGYDVSVWSPGQMKLHLNPFSNGKTIKITVFRCTNCGYLESYAK